MSFLTSCGSRLLLCCDQSLAEHLACGQGAEYFISSWTLISRPCLTWSECFVQWPGYGQIDNSGQALSLPAVCPKGKRTCLRCGCIKSKYFFFRLSLTQISAFLSWIHKLEKLFNIKSSQVSYCDSEVTKATMENHTTSSYHILNPIEIVKINTFDILTPEFTLCFYVWNTIVLYSLYSFVFVPWALWQEIDAWSLIKHACLP